MLLEDIREVLESLSQPRNKHGVVLFFNELNSIIALINPKNCSSYEVSERQYCVYNNALNLLIKYRKSKNLEDIIRCVSEIYDIAQNYMDTNHNVSIGELCLFETLLKLYNEWR